MAGTSPLWPAIFRAGNCPHWLKNCPLCPGGRDGYVVLRMSLGCETARQYICLESEKVLHSRLLRGAPVGTCEAQES